MKKSTIIISAIVVVIVIAAIVFFLTQNQKKEIATPEVLTISELQSKNLSSGIYSVEGYVSRIENCSCMGNGCPICIGKHIIIDEYLPNVAVEPIRQYIFTENSDQFSVNWTYAKKYIFTVKVLPKGTKTNGLDLELINYTVD